jgi:MoaA/NifB/PqqE/SkfB family radical SAM enzyme
MIHEKEKTFNEFIVKQVANLSSLIKIWKVALPSLEHVAYQKYVNKPKIQNPGSRKMREDQFYIAANFVRAAFKAYDNGSEEVRDRILNLFLKEFLSQSNAVLDNKRRYELENGRKAPAFLVISPGGTCNLRCKDCYASSIPKGLPSLPFETVDRILTEKYEKWGSWFTVVSGGEPFLWKDGDKGIIDIARLHPEQYFLIYTNGTFIDKKIAEELAGIGNITPAISVEGFEAETDDRRGNGVYQKILTAFKHLRDAGVPFGISTTATNQNAELIISKKMIEFYFKEQGALYQWVFQYMPIGRGADVDYQVSPEMRMKMLVREQEIVNKERLPLADFWNGGPYSAGCIAGGRSGGYLYIDWYGNIYPCVFVPFWKDNINELYMHGKTLDDSLSSGLFAGIREWQISYHKNHDPKNSGNLIRPCFIRDHYQVAHDLIIRTEANPGYESASVSLKDRGYYEKMIHYGKRLSSLLDPIWEKFYREP